MKALDYARTICQSEKLRIAYIKAEIGTGKHHFWSWLCIMAMYHGYVSWLCILAMYHGYVSWLCIMAMYHGYVSRLCIMAMYIILFILRIIRKVSSESKTVNFENYFKSHFDSGFRIYAKFCEDSPKNRWFSFILRRVMDETFFYRISVPMSYITFGH